MFYIHRERERCVMVDKAGNIISKEMTLKKVYLVAKENVALIAIAIPIVVAIFGYALEWYLYLYNCGYYRYFGIDGSLMLPYNRNGIYQYLGQLAWIALYWIYAIFSVRMLVIKKNSFLKKLLLFIILFILVPSFINAVIAYISYGNINRVLMLACVIVSPMHWPLIFALGYCLLPSSYQKVVDKIVEKGKKEKKSRLGNEEYGLLGILIILVGVIIIFGQGYWNNYRKAVDQRQFGIVEIDEEKYAVIDANEDKVILQKCEIDQTNLKIDKNTYWCISNTVVINFQTFDSVKVE